jgi:ComF family protein
MKKVYNVFRRFLTLDWLTRCCRCDDLAQRTLPLCAACEAELPWLTQTCWRCAIPLAHHGSDIPICNACSQYPPPFARAHALFRYDTPIDDFLIQLKFHSGLLYASLLGTLLAHHLRAQQRTAAWPDCLIPVPLHRSRLQQRGFNQALEIARPVSKILQIPLNTHLCTRHKMTLAQSDLPEKQRQYNVRNAFSVNRTVPVKHVAIIDDAMTTGHTVTAITNVLLANGVEQVEVWCVARTVLK